MFTHLSAQAEVARLCGLKSGHALPNVSLVQAQSGHLYQQGESEMCLPGAQVVESTDVWSGDHLCRGGSTEQTQSSSPCAKRQPGSGSIGQSLSHRTRREVLSSSAQLMSMSPSTGSLYACIYYSPYEQIRTECHYEWVLDGEQYGI